MTLAPLLIFDFDGVIVDGMLEYWISSRRACIDLMHGMNCNSSALPVQPPLSFVQLRPWVNHGWEMVLLAAELLREDGYLFTHGANAFSVSYQQQCQQALSAWGWSPWRLQEALENSRRQAILSNKHDWFALHDPYPWVLNRLQSFALEGVDWAVLTTKGRDFAAELLTYLNLHPAEIYGHESGNKIDVLRRISSNRSIKGFVEDRLATLEQVVNTVDLASVPCYLAGWGYLKPSETECALTKGIQLLSPENMATPLASWP